jgi:hypothetical protein
VNGGFLDGNFFHQSDMTRSFLPIEENYDSFHNHLSETSAFNIQTPGKYPEENLPHIKHGEILKI